MDTKATFTDLLRSPKDVLSHINEGDIIVSRRDGEDLVVSKASTRANDRQGIRLASAVIAASLGEGDFISRLHEPFPWITFLSNNGKRMFADEVVAVARGCAAIGHFSRLAVTITAWEATAAALAEGLSGDGSDLHYLAEPVTARRP